MLFQSETKDEIAALQKESEVPLDQLLESLPKEILEKPASISSEKDDTDKVGIQYCIHYNIGMAQPQISVVEQIRGK